MGVLAPETEYELQLGLPPVPSSLAGAVDMRGVPTADEDESEDLFDDGTGSDCDGRIADEFESDSMDELRRGDFFHGSTFANGGGGVSSSGAGANAEGEVEEEASPLRLARLMGRYGRCESSPSWALPR